MIKATAFLLPVSHADKYELFHTQSAFSLLFLGEKACGLKPMVCDDGYLMTYWPTKMSFFNNMTYFTEEMFWSFLSPFLVSGNAYCKRHEGAAVLCESGLRQGRGQIPDIVRIRQDVHPDGRKSDHTGKREVSMPGSPLSSISSRWDLMTRLQGDNLEI